MEELSNKTEEERAEKEFAERLEAEKQRFQMQKIEALGRLAGGIAHDFNNFLAVIMLHIDMLNLQIPPNSPYKHRVDEMKAVTGSAAAMVRQLLAVGRKQSLHPQPVVLNDAIKEFSRTLAPITGENIETRFNLEPGLGVCFVDKNQIIQILINLAVNAREAMPEGGVIEIKTANVRFEKSDARRKVQPNGDYIQITFSDNGIGMDTKTAEAIFEPFFSTKETRKGVGLGLATAYGVVKQSGGFIWVESEIDRGTTFKIQFPRVDQPIKREEKLVADETMPGGDETILVVDDEDSVRRLTTDVLKMLGYRVFEADGGAAALEFLQSFAEPIQLLLTDIEMPKISGEEVAEKFTALQPEAAVLFVSGDIGNAVSRHDPSQRKKFQFLDKPFSPSDLALKVRRSLDS